MKTTRFLFSIYALLLAACATAPEPEVRSGQRLATISVASAPAGQVIELNDRYLGLTPKIIRVPVTDAGTWKGSSLFVLRVSSLDGSENETKLYYPNEEPPSHVLFRLPRTLRSMQWAAARGI
jgi:hypothetical protein